MDTQWPSGQSEFAVTEEVVRQYVDACGGEWPTTSVPSTLASVYCYAAVAAMPVKAGVVLTGQSYQFHGELRVGDTAITSFAVREEFERKGRRYMVIETRTTNQHGENICTGAITRMLPAAPEAVS